MNVRIGKAKYLVADGGETDSRLQLACAGTEILWSGNSKFAISLVSFNLFFNINQALILGHSLSKYRSALWYHYQNKRWRAIIICILWWKKWSQRGKVISPVLHNWKGTISGFKSMFSNSKSRALFCTPSCFSCFHSFSFKPNPLLFLHEDLIFGQLSIFDNQITH